MLDTLESQSQGDPGSSSEPIFSKDDNYAKVFGKDRPDSVRGLGFGASTKVIYGQDRFTSQRCKELESRNTQLTDQVKDLQQKTDDLIQKLSSQGLNLGGPTTTNCPIPSPVVESSKHSPHSSPLVDGSRNSPHISPLLNSSVPTPHSSPLVDSSRNTPHIPPLIDNSNSSHLAPMGASSRPSPHSYSLGGNMRASLNNSPLHRTSRVTSSSLEDDNGGRDKRKKKKKSKNEKGKSRPYWIS